jgi:hypothetical protein
LDFAPVEIKIYASISHLRQREQAPPTKFWRGLLLCVLGGDGGESKWFVNTDHCI